MCYLGTPKAMCLFEINTFIATSIVCLFYSVAGVFTYRRFSQIVPSVAKDVSVFMVNIFRRQATFHPKPDQAVHVPLFAVNVELRIFRSPILMEKANAHNLRACCHTTPTPTGQLRKKLPRYRAIIEKFMQAGLCNPRHVSTTPVRDPTRARGVCMSLVARAGTRGRTTLRSCERVG